MGKLASLVRTRETYFEKIANLSLSSRTAKRIAIKSFDKFSEKEFNITPCEKMISDLKNESEPVMYDVLQKWINGLAVADMKIGSTI